MNDIERTDTFDPNDPAVAQALRNELLSKQRSALYDRCYYLGQKAQGKSVLDIGIVEHSPIYWDSPAWLHRYLHKNARRCLGVDINENGIKLLKAKGFEAAVVDVTSEADLGEQFDLVVAGEIIEHLTELDSFLSFCHRHANDSAELILSTPNPHYVGYVWDIFKKGTYIANAEHVSWIGPTHMIELARRSGWRLKEYTIIVGSQNKFLQNYVIRALLKLYRPRLPEWLGYAYLYTLTKGTSSSVSKNSLV